MGRVELLRSKFKRSTQKLHFMSTQNDYVFKIDMEDCALRSTWMIEFKVDIHSQMLR